MDTKQIEILAHGIKTQLALLSIQEEIEAAGKEYDAPWLKNAGRVTRDTSGRFSSKASPDEANNERVLVDGKTIESLEDSLVRADRLSERLTTYSDKGMDVLTQIRDNPEDFSSQGLNLLISKLEKNIESSESLLDVVFSKAEGQEEFYQKKQETIGSVERMLALQSQSAIALSGLKEVDKKVMTRYQKELKEGGVSPATERAIASMRNKIQSEMERESKRQKAKSGKLLTRIKPLFPLNDNVGLKRETRQSLRESVEFMD